MPSNRRRTARAPIRRVILAAATASIAAGQLAWANDATNYTGASALWSDPMAWDTGAQPQNGDEVYVINAAAAPATFTFDSSAQPAFLDSLHLDSTGGPLTFVHSNNTIQVGDVYAGATGTVSYQLNGPNSELYVFRTETLGDAGSATFAQTDGLHVAGSLTLGNSVGGSGTLNLSGTNSIVYVLSTETVGGAGSGTVSQSAGAHYVGNLVVGASGNGAFNLSGTGAVYVSGGETIGDAGVGLFTQTGGTHTANSLTVGASGSGRFTLSGSTSTLAVASGEIIGDSGVGRFTQSGGSHTASSFSIANSSTGSGTFTISGGTANFGVAAVGGSVSGSQGGVGTLTVTGGGSLTVASTFTVFSSGTVNLSGGTLSVDTLALQGGSLNWSSGTLNLTGTNGVVFDAGSTFKITTGQTLNVAGPITVGSNGTSAFNQSGGQNAAPSIDLGTTSTGIGQYSLSNTASLTVANNLIVGDAGQGQFNQTGGTLNVGNGSQAIYVGYRAGGSGVFNLSGGTLNVNNVFVGYAGRGVFNQYGGVHTLGGYLSLGGQPDGTGAAASGTYNLVNGTLTLNTLYTGLIGTGAFTQSNGYAGIGGSTAGYMPGSSGTVTLSGGTLFNFGDEIYGDKGVGTLNQTGGSHTSASLTLGGSAGGVGVANISGGNILIDGTTIVGNNGVGTVNQTGGTQAPLDMYVGLQAGSVGTYNLSNGATLHVSLQTVGGINYDGNEYLGYYSSGTINQTGGVHTVDTYFAMGRSYGGSSLYNLAGGSFSAPAQSVGYQTNGSNTFNQTGGANAASVYLTIGDQTGTQGVYNLSGANSTLTETTLYDSWAGVGTLNQSAGTNAIGTLYVAHEPTAIAAYNLSGGTLNVSAAEFIGYHGKGTFTQTGGVHTVAGTATVTVGAFVDGAGVYNLQGGSFTAGPVLNSGSVNISGGTASFTALTGAGNTTLNTANAASSSLTVKSFAQGSVTISGNALMAVTPASSRATNTATQLTISNGGKLDLANQNLLTSTSPSTIRSYLASGFNYGAWNGNGIASTSAALSAGTRSLGYAGSTDNAGVPTGQTLVKYTTPGDADLNGSTNFADFMVLQNHFNLPGGWAQGDFDYSGTVDFNDFLILQNNFGKSLNAAGLASPAAAAVTTLTSKPTVTYVLSPNDDGKGNPSPGHFAIYAVDSTSDGNRGLASFSVHVDGASSLTTLAPMGSYVTGGNLVDKGFTLLRTADSATDAAQGSQETIAAGAQLVYGIGQAAGDLGSDGLSTTQAQYDARVLLATGTYDDLSALAFDSAPGMNAANVFLADGTDTTAATASLQIVPEPASFAAACVLALGLLPRRRRVTP